MSQIKYKNIEKLIWEIINQDYQDPNFTVEILAKKLNVSVSYLRDISYSLFNISPHRLIENVRLDKSLQYLYKDDKIYLVSSKIGYLNSRSFRRTFKIHFGLTPVNFKRILSMSLFDKESLINRYRKKLWSEDIYKKVLILSGDFGP